MNTPPVVFQFPGQSSRYPGMIPKLSQAGAGGRELLAEASDILGRDLLCHYRADNGQAYARNRDVQVGVFLANHLLLAILARAGVRARASLGLSLGEWNHLVHIKALPFAAALRAVDQRGEAYDRGPRGMMVSVFPIALEELEQVVERARGGAVLEVVNRNSPRQQVLAGHRCAVQRAVEILDQEQFVEARVIEPELPMHSSLFASVAKELAPVFAELPFATPQLPWLPNRTARCEAAPERARFVELLTSQVFRPVLWRESVDHVLERHPDAVLVEVGPRAVLTNLLDRRWHKATRRLATDSTGDIRRHLESVVAELQGARAEVVP
jgi:[acyl-carrier-protein] S-malonyltransferase